MSWAFTIRKPGFLPYIALIGIVLVVDVSTKCMAYSSLADPIAIDPSCIVQWYPAVNSTGYGSWLLGIGAGAPPIWFKPVFLLCCCGFFILALMPRAQSVLGRVGISLMVCAGLGNSISIIMPPHQVVDCFYIWTLHRILGTGIVNTADLALDAGIVLTLFGFTWQFFRKHQHTDSVSDGRAGKG